MREGTRRLSLHYYNEKAKPKTIYGGVVYNFSFTQIEDYPWPSVSLPFLLKRPRPAVFDKRFYIKTNQVSLSYNLNKGQICNLCQMLAEHS
jgi:hypothetical protein